MKEIPNISKLIKPIVDEKGQTKLDFKSSEKLLGVLKEINDKYPLIREIIKDRISYNNGFFYINKKEMTEDELRSEIIKINKYEMDKENDDTDIDRRNSRLYGRD